MSFCDEDAEDAEDAEDEELTEAVRDLLASLERPLGKMTFIVKDQRAFDAAVRHLYEEIGVSETGVLA